MDFSKTARHAHWQSRCCKAHADQLRIRELERELAIAREESDLFKKATAYFAKLSK